MPRKPKGDSRHGTWLCKIMVNLRSKNRPEPATLNVGAMGLASDKLEQISKRTSA